MGDANNLGTEVNAIGRFIGLLKGGDGDVTVNTDWFGDPVTELEQVGTRLNDLVALIEAILGPGVTKPPDVFPKAQWYSIPDPTLGSGTVFHVVATSSTETGGQIGLGVLYPVQLGSLTIDAYLYVPFFSYAQGSQPSFITASASDPCQIGLYLTASDKFQVNGVSFTAMNVEAEIYLADKAPGFKLEFANLQGAAGAPGTYTSLSSLLDPNVEAWIGEVVVQGSAWLNMFVGYGAQTGTGDVYDNQTATNTVGDLLVAANFLTKDANGDYHLSLQNLHGQTASDIALNFVFAVLNALAATNFPIISLPGGGIYIARRDDANESSDYGIRFAIDIPLTSGAASTPGGGGTGSDNAGDASTGGAAPGAGGAAATAGDASPTPAVDLCIGTWLTGESDGDNWITRTTGSSSQGAGVSVFALNRDAGGKLSFAPSFELSSIGLNIRGGGDAPLIDVGGYTLKGAEVRAYLDWASKSYGFAARMDTMAFPLGPDFSASQQGGSGTNAVGQSLLASGGGQSGTSGDSGQPSTVNPGFSAEAAYVSGHDPLLEIFDLQGNKTDLIWFPVQRRFGPINCQKIGVEVKASGQQASDPVLGVVFDGDISLGGLDVYVDQLSVEVKLREAANVSGYDIDLQGLDVTFSGGGVEISGGLLKTIGSDGWVSYDGEAIIKIEDLTIAAIGSFGSLPGGGTSLFIFAMLNYPLGGPGCFFVTGLAVGFGYNRSLKIPAQDDVQSFPLIAGLANTSLIGGSNPSPATALAALETWVPPERGEYWLAAGVQYTTYEIINTNALLIVEFGKEFLISLLGLSTLKQPQLGDVTYVYAELDIEVVIDPGAGEFKASAVLASSSYVFTPQLHLTGGFAFYSWFGGNAHAGDFAFTIGGYHPAFTVPDYYPREPRAGINWQISDKILMDGEAYFAITPTAMMAGGGLQVTFADGPLKAWLKAQIDVILYWKPFYLLAAASISIGVSYRVDFLFVHTTLSVEISADFSFWGPPVGGKVHVDWYIISFTIGFGADPKPPTSLDWSAFQGMLPSKPQQPQNAGPAPQQMLLAAAATSPPVPVALYVNANAGLKSTQTAGGLTLWLVRAGQFQFTVGSAVPATTILVGDPDAANNQVTLTGQQVGLRRVNGGIPAKDYRSAQTVTILQLNADDIVTIKTCMATADPRTTRPSGCTAGRPVPVADWKSDPLTQNLPQAMWGGTENPDINQTTPTVTGTVGVVMSPHQPTITNCTPPMNIASIFKDRTVNPKGDEYELPLSQTQPPAANAPRAADSFADIAQVNAAPAAAGRTAVFNALRSLGVEAWTNGPLPLMAASPGRDFADEPLEGSVVSNLT